MDKETLSNYGWIVICTLILAVMIALATPFGEYIKDGVWSATNGLNDTLNKNMEIAGLSGSGDNNGDTPNAPDNVYTFTPTPDGIGFIDRSFNIENMRHYTLQISYNDGTTEEKQLMTVQQEDFNVTGLYSESLNYISSEDDYNSAFVFYNKCSVNDEGELIFSENESVYVLENSNKNYRQITSITIDFNKSANYFDTPGAIFGDGSFIPWNELKKEYDVTDTAIGAYAFRYEDIVSIVIPEGVTSIGDQAFYSCLSLTNISLPNSLTSIGESALHNCNKLPSIKLPDNITSIGESALSNCLSLTSIEIPKSITVLPYYVLGNCKSLTEVKLPDTLTTIGSNAFHSCKSLKTITIPNSVTTISDYAFAYCSSLTTIVIPDTVTSMGGSIFQSCSSLKNITLPANITSLNAYMFSNCTLLESITIPKNIKTIEYKTFYNCSSLQNITFKNTVEQWESVTKGYDWNYNVPATQVTCSDGVITL